MSEFKIEKGIPVPPRTKIGSAECPYPFAQMQIGDSFLIPVTDSQQAKAVKARLYFWAKRAKISVYPKTMDDGKTVRVWRVLRPEREQKAPVARTVSLLDQSPPPRAGRKAA